MPISSLEITNVRNLESVACEPHAKFNVFYGQNGSGKTSVLEAIHILSVGKSFRHHQVDNLINYNSSSLAVVGRLQSTVNQYSVGIEKQTRGKTTIRVNGENCHSAAALAKLLPQQLIHPDSDMLISGSPKLRRQFIDWGLFHVEQKFFSIWQQLQKILKQRNAALKLQQSREQISCWDEEYVTISQEISQMRRQYLLQLQPLFNHMINFLLKKPVINIAYQQGWQGDNLLALLAKNYYRDLQLGYTQFGPQRDDMGIYSAQRPIAEILSRGEQKLVVVALRLAQGQLLQRITNESCIFLLDDFAAELDIPHRQKMIEILNDLGAQVFLTTIELEEVKTAINFINPRLFHVEQGTLKQV
jgi:DNA replication and repair protein RecF